MKNYIRLIIMTCFITFLGTSVADAQIAMGRGFILEQAVLASGGGTSDDAANNVFKVEGTIGQAITGRSSNSPFNVKSGFWVSEVFTTIIGGQIKSAGGRGIYGVQVTLKDETGALRMTQTNPFGYYRFKDVEGNKSYTISIKSKSYEFAQTMLIFFVSNDFDQFNFTALP